MSAAESAKLLAAGATWRLAGIGAAGRSLVRAAHGDRESERTLAGMLLVQAGNRSVPILTEEILAEPGSPELVAVLASIGTPAAREALARVARSGPAPAADAATAALRALDQES